MWLIYLINAKKKIVFRGAYFTPFTQDEFSKVQEV
jgi:hypothetical protein